MFSREEVLRIKNKKTVIINTGNKVIKEKLIETKNKYKIRNKIERTIAAILKTAIIEKE
tara:strand:- start:328 stop:504 length:177 start_codon:yes stop_codon:yes gene_type:complete